MAVECKQDAKKTVDRHVFTRWTVRTTRLRATASTDTDLSTRVCVVSVCRTAYVDQVSLSDPSCKFSSFGTFGLLRISFTLRISGDDVNTVILSAVENCAGVVSACLPTMLPIARFLRHGRARSASRFNSAPQHQNAMKLSSLKKPLWTGSDHREPDKLEGSFSRLQPPKDERYSGSLIPSSEELETPTPLHPNAITVTTKLEQTRGSAAPRPSNTKPTSTQHERNSLAFPPSTWSPTAS